jgi:hypothetical protein
MDIDELMNAQNVKKQTRSEPDDVMWYVIESKVLNNERVLLVTKKNYLKQARKEHPDKAIYFPPEIKELARHEGCEKFEDLIRKVHMVKKEFRAWIVPTNDKEGGQQNGKRKA